MLSKAEIQRLRSLRDKKHREALGLFVIEGEKVVNELLAARHPFEEIYGTASWHGRRTREVSGEEMSRISSFPTPSTVLAVGRLQTHPLEPRALGSGLTLALDGVQDPGNVGTLIRIADWYGLSRVLLSPDCADLHSQKVINASMGSFARMKIHSVDLVAALAEAGVPVLGCDLEGDPVHALEAGEAAVIVIGSEGRGISQAVRARVTRFVTIPRYGQAESLNAAVAAAVVCDNLRRRGRG